MNGLIAWFARNGVAANLLMLALFIMGSYAVLFQLPVEGFPALKPNTITVSVPFRGATPAEVEEGVVIRIEEALHSLAGIDEIRSTANEGIGTVMIVVEEGYDIRDLQDDIKNRVDSINTFPAETEKPVISAAQSQQLAISVLVVAENLTELELRRLGEQVRDEITNLPEVSQADLEGVRPYEISIDVSEDTLQKYEMTIDDVARAVRQTSVDLPAGGIKTESGEVLLRTKGQAYVGSDFEEIVLRTRPDGSRLLLSDVASVNDGFEENELYSRYMGKPAVVIRVTQTGYGSMIEIANAVKKYLEEAKERMPQGVELTYWQDSSKMIKSRLSTLKNSAVFSGVIVFLLLAMFLRIGLAFWVMLGIPVAFMGALALLPYMGYTINIITLFALILMLGIVVDDAIVTGENIYKKMQSGLSPSQAAVIGTQEVSVPVTFGILTTVVAFLPLMFIPGPRGQIFAQIPAVVVPVLLFSLVESKLILPSHIQHLRVIGENDRGFGAWLYRQQQKLANGFEAVVHEVYRPLLAVAVRNRYVTLAVFLGGAMLMLGVMKSARIGWVFFPRVARETVTGSLLMPLGTPIERTSAYIDRMEKAAFELREKYTDEATGQPLIEAVLSTTGAGDLAGRRGGGGSGQSHIGTVSFELIAPETRSIFPGVESKDLAQEWRRMIGPIPGAKELSFRAEIGGGNEPVDVQLEGQSFDVLKEISLKLQAHLATYEGVFDVRDNFEDGKQEIKLKIKPEGQQVGLSMDRLAQQTRQAFFGAEAQRIQRNREDVRVMVRYPREERQSIANLQNMRIRTADGNAVPFGDVAEATMGRSFSTIQRIDRNRTVAVLADVDKEKVDMISLNASIAAFMEETLPNYPGVRYQFAGEAKEQRETFDSLGVGIAILLFILYALLAIPFRSYLQPLVVMAIIPFGLLGAVLGHMIMGSALSVISVWGMLALTGVVVNDSLVLVEYINRQRRSGGLELMDAVRKAGVARFRPIILTSLTTFFGLAPLIWEKSTQAQFLIPMAISLGFGILFATAITLVLTPVCYLLLEDLIRFFRWLFKMKNEPAEPK